MARISVLGAGSWGTALASLLKWNGHEVTLWCYLPEEKEELESTHENSKLPGVPLPDGLLYTTDLKEAGKDKDLIVFAVPSQATRSTAIKVRESLPAGQKVIAVAKGIEEGTLLTQCQILEEVLNQARVGILSGPSHAEEVIRKLPTVVVSGSKDRELAVFCQEVFMNPTFRVYTSPDVTGIELGGSLKNVIALAAGMSDGLGFGDNAKAALITRGIREISSLSVKMGASEATLSGLTGIGDLIVTCQSMHSRNRLAGYYIGQGMKVEDAMKKVKMVVEGVFSAKSALALGQKFGIELPIIEEVNRVLFSGEDPKKAVMALMTRDRKEEVSKLGWE